MSVSPILSAFAISVLASVFAVFVLLIFRALRNYVIDKYGNRLAFAHISDVSGEWKAESQDHQGNNMVELMNVRQLGSRISGVIHYTIHYQGGKVSHKQLNLEGIVRNDLISLYYYNANRRQKGIGACLLCLSHNGDQMAGKTIWWDVETNKIDCSAEGEVNKWYRSN